MRRPLIGITCTLRREDGDRSYVLDVHYVGAVRAAGGEPVLMPFFADAAEARSFLERVDGALFSGGPDLDPARWGEKPHPKAVLVDREKEESDLVAIREALAMDKATLAICLGCQELNVALGGSLHQHLPDVKGTIEHRKGAEHAVEIGPSRLRDIVKRRTPRVNSYHHQGIRRVGEGLEVVARAEDGVVEGIEAAGRRFVIGVQWHPERIHDREEQGRIFRAFVAAAGRGRTRHSR
jgi:gamma-glutamyl-gamma-aminobutyrate hydrolase PuuD